MWKERSCTTILYSRCNYKMNCNFWNSAFALFAFSLLPGQVVQHVQAVLIDFDEPRKGPICVATRVSDSVTFKWEEYHNLHELTDENAYRYCSFASATKLADAAPNSGVSVRLGSTPTTRYFSCSKICSSHGHKVRLCVVGPSEPLSCPCAGGREFTGDVVSSKASRRNSYSKLDGILWCVAYVMIFFWTRYISLAKSQTR
ncbi:unnamed protein product [Amoebophrya sp. A25]|nr:unnamed protein product [Amoebophrya sp. A25]|eukprot:GSA25T00020644001.1